MGKTYFEKLREFERHAFQRRGLTWYFETPAFHVFLITANQNIIYNFLPFGIVYVDYTPDGLNLYATYRDLLTNKPTDNILRLNHQNYFKPLKFGEKTPDHIYAFTISPALIKHKRRFFKWAYEEYLVPKGYRPYAYALMFPKNIEQVAYVAGVYKHNSDILFKFIPLAEITDWWLINRSAFGTPAVGNATQLITITDYDDVDFYARLYKFIRILMIESNRGIITPDTVNTIFHNVVGPISGLKPIEPILDYFGVINTFLTLDIGITPDQITEIKKQIGSVDNLPMLYEINGYYAVSGGGSIYNTFVERYETALPIEIVELLGTVAQQIANLSEIKHLLNTDGGATNPIYDIIKMYVLTVQFLLYPFHEIRRQYKLVLSVEFGMPAFAEHGGGFSQGFDWYTAILNQVWFHHGKHFSNHYNLNFKAIYNDTLFFPTKIDV
jgi:hypothetical protein